MAHKKYFSEVDHKVNFPEMEKTLVHKWYTSGVVDKYLHKNDKSTKYFSFVDGPITANNPMGVHHGWGRTYKDLWQKYKNMQGFKQRFQNGFDSQGLWVEVEVEKELGFKSKKDIEVYGVDKFVVKCKERVLKYSNIQTEQSKRLGYFMDWDNSYYTMSDANNYMIWHFLKTCNENGWLYKGQDSVPWCPRCETAISQHEILAENYDEVTHKSIYFQLPITGRNKEFLLVWTTTPWTIPANIAVAVDKNKDYILVESDTGNKFWLTDEAKNRVFKKSGKVLKKVKGKDLVGLRYSGPFDQLHAVAEIAKNNPTTFHTVIPTDDRIMPISSDEGTGIVHTAVSAGTEDFKLGMKLGLPMISVIADDASYLEGFGEFTGKNAKENPNLILDYMVSEDKKDGVDWVFDIQDYTHRYPRCWRCKTELVWKVTDEWYIAMDKPSTNSKSKNKKTLRERMIDVTTQINWIPEFGLKRELDWLNNMHDWLISKKNRYWGLCLPIWVCELGHFDVIGSKEELEKRAVSGWGNFVGKSPHKPQIDDIKIKCSECGMQMSRIEPVGNPWLDAGIVPFSTVSSDNSGRLLYKEDRNEWLNWIPADFITESFPGQFKNWFYSMIAMSTVLEDSKPFETVLGYATALAEDGREMHKSWGNSIEFNEGADKIGVDVMRWMYAKQNYAHNLLFGYNIGDEVRRQFHLKIWNTYNYFVTYSNLNNWKPEEANPSKSYSHEHILDSWILIRLNKVILDVTNNLDQFNAYNSTILLEEFVDDLSNWYIRRSRDRVSPISSETDKQAFLSTLYVVLVDLMKLLAPFMPFMTDVIFTNLTKEESVHLADWPKGNEISNEDKTILQDMNSARVLVEMGQSKRKELQIPVRQPLNSLIASSFTNWSTAGIKELVKDELNIKKIIFKKSSEMSVEFDTQITPELEEEAKTRELIRNIQNERKNLGVQMDDSVIVTSEWLPKSKELLSLIKNKTIASSLIEGEFSVKKA